MFRALFTCTLFGPLFCLAQGFFTPDNYIGAFGTVDWTQGWTNWNPRASSYPAGTVLLQGNITSPTALKADKTYLLKGYVYVKNNTTLTIEPGTIIRSDVLSASALIITKGSKLICDGTPSNPIVFTSSEGTGARTYGDWGGIVLLGKARINANGGSSDIGAGINNANGDGLFGGNDDEDSSGSISYTRIEFAGVQYQPDKEISALALGAVGRRTQLHHIQISFCGNDGIHIAGGTAQLKHLALFRGYNSDITMDMGYTGLIQYAVILRDSTKAGSRGASGLEIQNDALATQAQPFTDPTLSNVTFLGPLTLPNTPYNSNFRYAVHLRRNGRCAVFNSAIAGYTRGLMLDGMGVGANMSAGLVVFQNNQFAGMKTMNLDTTNRFAQAYPDFNRSTWLLSSGFGNGSLSAPRDLQLTDPYTFFDPNFLPLPSTILTSGASYEHPRLLATANTQNSNLASQVHIGTAAGGLQFFPSDIVGDLQVQIMDITGKVLREFIYDAAEGIVVTLQHRGNIVVRMRADGVLYHQRVLFLGD